MQRFTFGATLYLGVGIPLDEVGAQYFEAFPLDDTEQTLRVLFISLVIGSAVITLLAAAVGVWTSRRLLRPLDRISAPPVRSPPVTSTPGSPRNGTPTSPASSTRSTPWPTPSRPESSGRPLRLRRQPRTALTDHRPRRGDRGARSRRDEMPSGPAKLST